MKKNWTIPFMAMGALMLLVGAGCQSHSQSPYQNVAHKMDSSRNIESVKKLVPAAYVLTFESQTKLRYYRPSSGERVEMLEFRFDQNGFLEWVATSIMNLEASPTSPKFDQEVYNEVEQMRKAVMEKQGAVAP